MLCMRNMRDMILEYGNYEDGGTMHENEIERHGDKYVRDLGQKSPTCTKN